MEVSRAEFKRLIIAIVLVLIAFYIAIFLIIRPYQQRAIKASISRVLVVKHCKKEVLSKKNGIVKYIKRCQVIKKNESINRSPVPINQINFLKKRSL